MKKYNIIFFMLLLALLFVFPAKAQTDPDSIVIVAPPDSDTSLMQRFPLVFNMDTDVVDWEDYTFYPFADAELARIANPDKSGLNETDFVLEYTKPEGSAAWAGFFYLLENPVNLTDESVFKLNVWSPRADIEATLKLEVYGGVQTGDLKADVTVAGEWVELVWDLSDQNQETKWDLVVVIMDLDVHPVPETETWYVDDFRLEGVVKLDPDRIVIVEPPEGDASLLQPFPVAFNMDTDVVDWYDYTFFPFSGAELARIANPDKSGLNETDHVLEYTKPEGSDAWAGFFYHLENPVNLTDESVFKLNVWSPRADIEAIMKLEVMGGPATGDLKADVTVAGEWVELVWDLSDQNQETNWDRVVVIMDLDVHPVPETETWYLDDFRLESVIELDIDRIVIVEPPAGDASLLQPFPVAFNMDTDIVDWESYTFFPFSGSQLARIGNPDKSGLNETNFVLEYTKPQGSDAWAGFFYQLENPINVTDESVFKLNVWSPRADIEAIMKLEVTGGPATGDLKADVTAAGEWVELVWDLSGQNQETDWDRVVVIMDLDVHPVPETETWYVDDFRLEGVVELEPERIAIVAPPDGDPFVLQRFPVAFNMDTDDVDWEDYTIFPFEGAQLARIPNPDKSGLNETDYVLEYTKPQGSMAWAGFFYLLENPVNLTDQSVFRLNFWSPRADIEAIMKLEVEGTFLSTGDLKKEITVAGEWVELEWDLSDKSQEIAWNKVVVIVNLDITAHPVPVTEIWYVDDFRLEGITPVSVEQIADAGIPERYELSQNYPNPFNPSTTIRFALPEASNVQLEIYNVMGQRVNTLIGNEMYNAGFYEVVWNGRDQNNIPVASGMYLYRITAGEFTQIKRMVFLK